MADKKLTGFDKATVLVKEPREIMTRTVQRGEPLPANLAEGELERLEKLGAFEEKTHAEKVRGIQQRVRDAQRELVGDPSGKVEKFVNRPETPWVDRPPSGFLPEGTETADVKTSDLIDEDQQALKGKGKAAEGGPAAKPMSTEESNRKSAERQSSKK